MFTVLLLEIGMRFSFHTCSMLLLEPNGECTVCDMAAMY